MKYISRAGEKLDFALDSFDISVYGKVCADFGSNVGGFVGVLIEKGAKKVYSVDTSYGTLDWNLRNNPTVVVLERTNAMHIKLPEKCDLITVDVGWTSQVNILPNVLTNLNANGDIVSLLKPHYEARKYKLPLVKGKFDESNTDTLISKLNDNFVDLGVSLVKLVKSPIKGKHGGNTEYLLHLKASKNL